MLTEIGWQGTCFASLLSFAFTLYNHLVSDHYSELVDIQQVEPEYDFVIIGGGSAGSVVANRLSEVGKWHVLLLEAGGSETQKSDVPFLAVELVNTDFDWKYRTEPPKSSQNYCLSMINHSCVWPRGKVVGGSSVLNYMHYVRANRHDYDHWESLGNKGWGYKDVLRYFLKSENNSNPKYLRTPYHASGGPLNVQDIPFTTPMAHIFVKGGEYLGYKHVDVNGKNQTGFAIPQVTQRNGRRCSTSKAFVAPIQRRQNLHISMHSFVTRIGFKEKDTTPTAKTVYFIKGNREYSVRVKKEIVLSGGAVNSPQLLMLSGIGPEEHLQDHGIDVLKDLRVGYRLQDHLTTSALTFKLDEPITLKATSVENPDSLLQYMTDGSGPLTSPEGAEGMAFVNSKYANRSGSYPDIQLVFRSMSLYNNEDMKPFGANLFNLRPGLFNGTGYNHLLKTNLFNIYPVLLRPESKGRILLQSKDPCDHPVIVPNYLAKEKDVKVLVDGLKLALRLVKTPPFRQLNAVPLTITFPGCEKFKPLFCDKYLECLIRHFTFTFWSPAGTCPMGVNSDAVVDPRLRVWGVKGLRVVDASVMPRIASGNLNAPTVMIAEKGCDMIKEDWHH